MREFKKLRSVNNNNNNNPWELANYRDQNPERLTEDKKSPPKKFIYKIARVQKSE